MMFRKILVTILIAIASINNVAIAQTPIRLNQFDYWSTYFYKANNSTVCYTLSMPIEHEPSTVKHGDNFFLISKRLGESATFEPQFMAGYNLRDDSHVTISIGSQDFNLFTNGVSAWINTATGEQNLVAAMKAGKTMRVKAVSQRGTNTTYTYSLKGVTAAINSLQKCK